MAFEASRIRAENSRGEWRFSARCNGCGASGGERSFHISDLADGGARRLCAAWADEMGWDSCPFDGVHRGHYSDPELYLTCDAEACRLKMVKHRLTGGHWLVRQGFGGPLP